MREAKVLHRVRRRGASVNGWPDAFGEVIAGRLDSYFCPVAPALPFIYDDKLIVRARAADPQAQ
jgi:hypothetical protein